MFRLGRTGADRTHAAQARSEAFDREADGADEAGIHGAFGIGEAIGSVIHSTMFGLIRTFDPQSYLDERSRRR